MYSKNSISQDISRLRERLANWHIVKGESFISALGIHPKALEYYDFCNGKLVDIIIDPSRDVPSDPPYRDEIEIMIEGYDSAREFYIDKLSKSILNVHDKWKPTNIFFRTTDFRYRELENIRGIEIFETRPQNLDLGNRGVGRCLIDENRHLLSWEFEACARAAENKRVRVAPLFPFVRGAGVLSAALQSLSQSSFSNPVAIGMMVEIPDNCLIDSYANVMLAFRQATGAEPFFVYGLDDLLMTYMSIPRDGSLTSRHGIDSDMFPWYAFNFKAKSGFWEMVNRALIDAATAGIHSGVGIEILEQALVEVGEQALWLRRAIDFYTEDHYIVDIPGEIG